MKQLNLTFLNDLNLQLRHNSWDFTFPDTSKFKPESNNKFITLAPDSGTKTKTKTKDNKKREVPK